MHESGYDHVRPKQEEKAKLAIVYIIRLLVIVYMKTEYIYVQDQILQITNQRDHYLKGGKEIGLMKDELGGKIMTELLALRPKTRSYLRNKENENKKAKDTKNCHKTKT